MRNKMCAWTMTIVFCACVTYVSSIRWTHSATLSPDYRIFWSFLPTSQDVTFELQVRTLGYVGFGFSKDGRMAGADMVIGWVDHGQVYFQDRHVKRLAGNSMDREPEVDPKQDYQLLLGYENGTHTVLRFKRRMDTCDHHDVPITNDTMRIVWAFHQKEPVGGAVGPGSLPQHDRSSRGTRSLYLTQRVDQEVPRTKETTRIWELRNPSLPSPTPGDSLYWCKIFRLPNLARKHHMIRYEPLEGIGSVDGLQHLVLYECQDTDEVTRLSESSGRQCFGQGVQPLACNTAVASWARGSEGFSFPPEAGYPLGPTSGVGPRHYLLETHYTSGTSDDAAAAASGSGTLDASGLRLYYTPEVRRHDAGVMSIGIDPNWRHIIPPGQQRVVSSGHCVAECTRQAFPRAGINMFAVVMKTHRIGRQVALRHVRGTVEQAPVASDDNLDADYQEYRKLKSPVRIMPGDHLIAECTYNSSGRTAITLGGLSSREETCLVIGLYYPRQKSLTACHSLPSLPTVLHSLGIQELSAGSNPVRITAPAELAGMTLETRLVSYDWDNQYRSFQEATMKGSFKPLCWTSQATYLPGTDTLDSHYPNITRPYIKLDTDQCNNNYRRYSTEGWAQSPGDGDGGGGGGGTEEYELNGNHIENNNARNIVSRHSPSMEETLSLSRYNNRSTYVHHHHQQNLLIYSALLVLLALVNR